jgi:endoglucanase
MKYFSAFILFFFLSSYSHATSYIRLNQVGYLNDDIKKAVLGSGRDLKGRKFFIKNLLDGRISYSDEVGSSKSGISGDTPFQFNYLLNFSDVRDSGSYRMELEDGTKSPRFEINSYFYKSIIAKLLYFLKVARCGDTKPELHKACHIHDATNVDLDLTGGWHDAGDFLKFTHQIAYTSYLLLLSYEINKAGSKEYFGDYDENGIPDILDEAQIGIDYLVKCYADESRFVYMVGDFNGDHSQATRRPEDDILASTQRPAIFKFDRDALCKYAYTMALASTIFKDIPGNKSKALNYLALAKRAYDKARSMRSENYDKLCLAATELYMATKEKTYLSEAKYFNEKAAVSYWGGWANNTNLANARIAPYYPESIAKLKESVEHFYSVSQKNIFGFSVPYAWGSLYTAISSGTAGLFYNLLTGDDSFDDLPRHIKDYTLGVNPWGVCFISGLGTVYPKNIHNNLAVMLKREGKLENATIAGAVAEGPYDRKEWEKNWSKRIPPKDDIFSAFQTSEFVYHDHVADYATNEPTIYGAAEAILFFSFYVHND